MDRLNSDTLKKKNLAAFYTPEAYAAKSAELLKLAVKRVPRGWDYVIIDRCAGTGNLEKELPEEILSHCILSTIDRDEYLILKKRFFSKLRLLLPPSDALSREFVENPLIRSYIEDPHCSIILYENPPYAEANSIEHQKNSKSRTDFSKRDSFLLKEMKKEAGGSASNEICNAFIWSGFKYYLRQATDSYILLAPVKYWKVQNLVNCKFISGFGFNRRHFGTRVDAFIMAALWANEPDTSDCICLKGYDINKKGELTEPVELKIFKIHSLYSSVYYDKRPFIDESYDGILTRLNGLEDSPGVKRRIRPLYSAHMLGYLVADSAGFDNPDSKSSLLSAGRYNGNGFYLHDDNYLEKLPLFAASRYTYYNRSWTEQGRIMKSADGAENYFRDLKKGLLGQWLLKCLLFCCLDGQNHMRSFYGSDGRYYKNQICLDGSNGKTAALKDLEALEIGNDEKELIFRWQRVFSEASVCPGYEESLSYGVHQIRTELDSSQRLNNTKLIYDNSDLHGELLNLKKALKAYYLKEIVPILFKYEFLK